MTFGQPAQVRILAFAILFVLAACNGAGRDFRGVAPLRAEAGGDRFVLRIVGSEAEAIRVNPRAFPNLASVGANAARATLRASGCIPVWVVGDPSMMRLGLSCEGAKPPKPPRGDTVLSCDVLNWPLHPDKGLSDAELVCRPG